MTSAASRPLPRWLPGLVLLAVVIWLFRDTAASMVEIWRRHQTYQHAFLVLPIALWLAWRQRATWMLLPTKPSLWALAGVLCASLLWLLGDLARVGAASQFGLVFLLMSIVPAVYGWQMARALWFPLLFLLFAVPFGEFTVPTMMDWTADFTVAALRWVGIPVYQEGLFFVIPSGNWSVIEACSGVRYLIASVMVGTLFAYLNYRSTTRRLLFILAAIVMPLIANWLRAFMIVLIGHLSNNRLAVGVDHLLYGWVFFGLVIGLLFFVGARFSDTDGAGPMAALPASDASGVKPEATRNRGVRGLLIAPCFVAITLAAHGWASQAREVGHVLADIPAATAPTGWRLVTEPMPWEPGFVGPTATRTAAAVLEGAGPAPVWEWVGYYGSQDDERKLVSVANRVVLPKDNVWRVVGETWAATAVPVIPQVRATTLSAGSVLNMSRTDLVVWRVYWIDGHWVSDERVAKVRQAVSALALRGEDGAVVLFGTPDDDNAAGRLEQYLKARAPALSAELQSVRNIRP